ncbi:MAG: enoyl-CoA hydratase-related protein, partial [Chloroflexota bacterium]
TLNRPDVRNALNDAMSKELHHAMLTCDEDKEIRAVLLHGAGKSFSSGGDLKSFAEHIDNLSFHIKDTIVFLHSALTRIARMDKPVVVAAHGNVAGAGISFMGAADIVVAAESATFTMAYTAVGLSPDGSSTFFLPRLIGQRRALELALTNRRLSAQEALDWGLVNQVAPDDKLLDESRGLAMQLANGPTKAFGAAKRLIRNSLTETLETQMEYEAQSIAEMAATKDFAAGVTSFIKKEPPKFTGE